MNCFVAALLADDMRERCKTVWLAFTMAWEIFELSRIAVGAVGFSWAAFTSFLGQCA